jgi:hypothetical protein
VKYTSGINRFVPVGLSGCGLDPRLLRLDPVAPPIAGYLRYKFFFFLPSFFSIILRESFQLHGDDAREREREAGVSMQELLVIASFPICPLLL